MMFNTAVALGPAAGGLIYAGVGPAWCFTINGLSFIAVIAALLAMRLTPQPRPERRGAVVDELVEGMRYVFTHQAVRTLIFLVAVVSLFALSFVNLVPAWANKILHGGATTNGLLLSARGLGAVAGALVLVVFSHYRIKGKLLTIGTVTFPVFLLIFAYIRQLPLALVVLALVGATSILVINLANALVQSLVPDALRGRAMGVYTFIFFGSGRPGSRRRDLDPGHQSGQRPGPVPGAGRPARTGHGRLHLHLLRHHAPGLALGRRARPPVQRDDPPGDRLSPEPARGGTGLHLRAVGEEAGVTSRDPDLVFHHGYGRCALKEASKWKRPRKRSVSCARA